MVQDSYTLERNKLIETLEPKVILYPPSDIHKIKKHYCRSRINISALLNITSAIAVEEKKKQMREMDCTDKKLNIKPTIKKRFNLASNLHIFVPPHLKKEKKESEGQQKINSK